MKNLIISIIIIVFSSVGYSLPPEKFSFQAILRDQDNSLITNQTVGVQISILQGGTNGTAIYIETHTALTNNNGLLRLEIGEGSVQLGVFENIDWSTGTYYLNNEIDPEGGTNYLLSMVTQLLSVPYALYAKTAEKVMEEITVNEDQIIDLKEYALKSYLDEVMGKFIESGAIVIDADGNVYPTVRIGPFIWMTRNLRTTSYNDGTPIPYINSTDDWTSLTSPGYCWYNHDSANYAKEYGALYNGYSLKTDSLCPVGWSIASQSDWLKTAAYAGTTQDLCDTMFISIGILANSTGFTAKLGGGRGITGSFNSMGLSGNWWLSEVDNANEGHVITILDSSPVELNPFYNISKSAGFSVRCVKKVGY